MPTNHTKAETSLRKLGQRLRAGWAKRHPTFEKQLETVRGVIRDQWQKERAAKREQEGRAKPGKNRDREGPEPDTDH